MMRILWLVITAPLCWMAVRRYRKARRLYQQQQAVAHGRGWY